MSVVIKGFDKPSDCDYCNLQEDSYCNVLLSFINVEHGIDTRCPLTEISEYKLKNGHRVIVAEKTEPKVKESPSLVKDLVKAFCEDGTWLERQGVYTLTLVEAKQRAVDIIESVVTDTEQTEPSEWNCAACEHFRSDTEEDAEKCIYCHEGSNFQCVKTEGEE